MSYIKKIISYLILSTLLFLPFYSVASEFRYNDFWGWAWATTAQVTSTEVKWWVLDWLLSGFWVWGHTSWNDSAVSYIKSVINYFLLLVWFVALIVVIYWFYLMLFSSEHDDAYGKAKKYIFNWTIALIIMWVSWFIVSFIIYIVERGF